GALLEPGLHRLGLAVPGNPTFEAITARHGERNHPISAGLMPRYRYLYSFLGLGVTGSYGNEKNGGFLFMGSRSQTLDLGHDQGGELAFRVQNSTNGPGSVKIGFGQDLRHAEMSADLEPHERRDLRIPVPAGQRYATLASSGPDAGLFLWGAPRFRSFLTGGPPVVIITLDTTRRDALSPYAPEVTWTPRLQALADRSTVFDHAHATSPWTLPSHGSLFTGLYPSRHGAGVATHRLEPGIPSLAELLADAGYTNGGVAGGPFTRFTHGLARGFDVYHSPEGYETYADELTDFGLQFLDGFGDGPFLLFLNYFDPHFPYRAPDAYRERFDLDRRIEALPDGPWRRALGTGDAGAFQTIIDRDAPPDEETLALALDTYRAEVAYTDAQVGRLLDALDAAGRFDEALIIVTSDHGESLGEGGNFSHSIRLDPELIEIPLIVKWPGQTEPSRVTELASLVDIFATVLEVAGVEDPGFVDAAGGPGRRDGLTLAQDGGELHRRGWLLMEEHDAPHHTLFESTKIADHLYGVQEAGRRQVLWEGGETCAEGVPGAWRSTGCDAEVLARSRALAARLQREARRSDLAPQALSEEERARLKALGYIR
ncbi:MAG: sulfatase, partial [Acidobacteriota bacterium]